MFIRNVVLSMIIISLAGCQGAESKQGPTTDMNAAGDNAGTVLPESTARLHVLGMSCPLCANNITKQLHRLPGVRDVSINLGTGLVLVQMNPSNSPSREQLTDAIAQSGFTLDRVEMPGEKGGDNE